jgi:hypothetical protein
LKDGEEFVCPIAAENKRKKVKLKIQARTKPDGFQLNARLKFFGAACLWLALLASARAAGPQSSADYQFTVESIDGGGLRAASADYTGDGSFGAGSFITSADYAQRGGYIGQLNNLPVAGVTTIYRTAGLRLKIAWSDVTTNWSDADGYPVTLSGLNLVTTNLINLTTNSTWIFYTNSPNVNDQITYTISDSQGTNPGVINVVINPFVSGQQSGAVTIVGSSVTVTNYGIPTFTYVTQRSTNLVNWVSIATNTVSSNGVINVTDTFGDLGGPPASAYYRLGWSP